MRKIEIDKEEKIQKLEESIKNMEISIREEKDMAIKDNDEINKDITNYLIDIDKSTTQEQIEILDKYDKEDKIKFEAEWNIKMNNRFKELKALKRKLKRLKAEKPKPELRKTQEFKIEPLI